MYADMWPLQKKSLQTNNNETIDEYSNRHDLAKVRMRCGEQCS